MVKKSTFSSLFFFIFFLTQLEAENNSRTSECFLSHFEVQPELIYREPDQRCASWRASASKPNRSLFLPMRQLPLLLGKFTSDFYAFLLTTAVSSPTFGPGSLAFYYSRFCLQYSHQKTFNDCYLLSPSLGSCTSIAHRELNAEANITSKVAPV